MEILESHSIITKFSKNSQENRERTLYLRTKGSSYLTFNWITSKKNALPVGEDAHSATREVQPLQGG